MINTNNKLFGSISEAVLEREIFELLKVVKAENKFNLDNIVNEELREFRQSIIAYEDYKYLYDNGTVDSKKVLRKKFEDVIYEAGDVFVVLSQLDITLQDALQQYLNGKELFWFNRVAEGEEEELFKVNVLFKLIRTIRRNTIDYYK